MTIYFYQKSTESAKDFAPVISPKLDKAIVTKWIAEQRRSFELWNYMILHQLQPQDIVVVQELSDLGIGKADILNQLQWFIHHSYLLFIVSIPASYEEEWTIKINHAVLETVIQIISQCGPTVLPIPLGHKNSGRKPIPFPKNWESLYQQWEKHEITSQEFIQKSGLRKGTFYHMLADYERIQEENTIFWETYKLG